ncbi:MAG: electron transfer flavoprotein subunit alpha [Endomicrobium sp.]|jgi:electron transfer flavoprotein alpha subunit|nr:electron transfer flavoprotein subunit alpha [Endomicrobium sp.]
MANIIKVLSDKCTGCGQCADSCPFGAVSMCGRSGDSDNRQQFAVIDLNKCMYCGSCIDACKFGAVELKKDEPYLSVDKSKYNGVWVFAEQRHGKIANVVYELLNEGGRLAKKLEVSLSAVLIGSGIKSKADDLVKRGADKVYVCDDPVFSEFQDDPYTSMLVQLIDKEKPEIILMGATNMGRSFASRVAARIHTGLTADCTSLEIDAAARNLQQTRPAFGGNIMATILTPCHRPQMSTVRCRIFKESKIDENRKGEIIDCKVDASALPVRTNFLAFVKDENTDLNISDVDIIVSGGRGVGKADGFKLLKDLADILGGSVGASRAAVDFGWIPPSRQIGQTGKIVGPKVYIACGISGQIQHVVGMNSSDIIIAINKDPDCPMMRNATYAVEGDLYEIIPNMIKEIKSIRGTAC